ncbi:ABC transporter substrate-binding protein [Agrobacterium sp. SHOUNA12C]|uniref:sn-glycerol-3-phosphate-binding periplasmic protein UgpB n=2 Tax=Rhizobium rhizogenes TaxID=359 RepID=B9JB33_RHIR8|nr:ABC transporter substrate-binding protein [Rhizobium rhizogenes]ACM27867.1 sn-glycerol-3-phosphate ABC transporter [Rhizobium rhizogenes K84]MCJ9724270.1 ABC transporter substrate-binding protein [Agrobacterium sp. BETTINA12B]MCJ9761333.1 ABC transporter substrate-binding protein [Agrobacterium sp. SHOUNA12C]KEA04301.1 glycerol-3-phosphate ABC transporter substrate-binding protein [Rhizobium rhizogenes]MQB34695.1 ABC transporter substrate-binding protein [Rhizobium rhizogenes]
MKHITQILAAAAISMVVSVPAYAETTLTVHYPMPGFFKNVMDTISKKFMEENPDIKIQFAAPSATYEEGIQTILRQAGTSEMPDVTFIGLNRLRMMDERNVAVDLGSLVQKDGNMAAQGFSDTILKLAQVKGKQVGLAFATSNPIMYYNADLVKAAGGDPDNPPKTWDEVITLAGKIKALGNGVDGMDFRWQGDDWMFSALLFGAGGKMLSDDESKVAFNGPEGQKAVALIQRFVKEGGMPVFTKAAGEQAFAAGKVGFEFQTTGALVNTVKNVGAKFDLRTAKIPLIDPVNGRLPTGGNAVVILTHDPVKEEAAWKFAKFAAGPYGASVVVPGTGYVPNNELAAKSAEYLGDFYKKNPLFQAGLSQMPVMIPWYAFPGANGVKVTQTIVDNLSRIVDGSAEPKEALDDAASDVEGMLPRS